MPCYIIKSRRMTRGEQFKLAGVDDSLLVAAGKQDEMVGGDTFFSCGSDIALLCKCGHLADLLCDYPVGRGKTCDLPMCPECGHSVGDDRDLCEIHWHMFKGKAGDVYIGGKVPRLVK